jgi:hypothetical protein
MVSNVHYHANGHDGVSSTSFEPDFDQAAIVEDLWHDDDDWGSTDEIILQDGISFVAGWRTATETVADSDGDGCAEDRDMPDFTPVYVRTHVDTLSETSVMLTLYVEIRNLQQPCAPHTGAVDIHWKRVETGTQALAVTSAAQRSGAPVAVVPLYPDDSTEAATWSGQSTLYLEHSWLLDRTAWESNDGFLHPFTFTVAVDSDGDVAELGEGNNTLTVTAGSWSLQTGFGGPISRVREVHVSPDLRQRMVGAGARTWKMAPVDASAIGDADFFSISLATVSAADVAAALSLADQGDLFTATVLSAGVVFADIAH